MNNDNTPGSHPRFSGDTPEPDKSSGRIERLLSDAHEAQDCGKGRLAIHLYCAAFEMSVEQTGEPTLAAIDGLRHAWLLACEEGDRQSAETIFNDLLPYNTQEQTENAINELQGLALVQLEELGVDKEEISEIASQLLRMPEAGMPKPQIISLARQKFIEENSADSEGTSTNDRRREDVLNYNTLVGFDLALEKMREFGLSSSDDHAYREFLAQIQSFHGVCGPVLSESFLFSGDSREDLGLFAMATAGEIGRPIINMMVELDATGNGVIKVIAPQRKSIFASQRFGEIPGQCTLVIQNIDYLLQMFRNEVNTLAASPHSCAEGAAFNCFGQMSGSHPRTMQNEIMSHLDAMISHSDTFVIATTCASLDEEPMLSGERLLDLIGPICEIHVGKPCKQERCQVLQAFAEDHYSFKEIDNNIAGELMDGMSRFEIVAAAQDAVEKAYRESLRLSRHTVVTWDFFLNELMHWLDPEDEPYKLVEDLILQKFRNELPDYYDSSL
jgi:hypothetical protein